MENNMKNKSTNNVFAALLVIGVGYYIYKHKDSIDWKEVAKTTVSTFIDSIHD